MILTKPSFKIISNPLPEVILPLLEEAGRTCYKSEDKITPESASRFIKGIIKSGHHTVIEHQSVSVRVICDRGISHEIVRHRIASYSQESTRYCDYNDGHVEFIIPPWVSIQYGTYKSCDYPPSLDSAGRLWFLAIWNSEARYKGLREEEWAPQQARSVLPNSLKTEIVMTMNLREWRHFFKLRALGTTGKPHPQMLEIAIPMLEEFKKLIPVIFDDLEVK